MNYCTAKSVLFYFFKSSLHSSLSHYLFVAVFILALCVASAPPSPFFSLFFPTLLVQTRWDPSKFNFYKADPLEFMFEYVPSFQQNMRMKVADVLGASSNSGGRDESDGPASGDSSVGTKGERRQLPALPGVSESVGDSTGASLVGQGQGEGGQRKRRQHGEREGGCHG